jgi:hypothetical protein
MDQQLPENELPRQIKVTIGSVILAFAAIITISAFADLLRLQLPRSIYALLVISAFASSSFITVKMMYGKAFDGALAGLLFAWISTLLFQQSLLASALGKGPVAVIGLFFLGPLPYVVLGYLVAALGVKFQNPRFRFVMERQQPTKRSFKIVNPNSPAHSMQTKSAGHSIKVVDPNLPRDINKINRPKRSFNITNQNSPTPSVQTKSTERSFNIIKDDSPSNSMHEDLPKRSFKIVDTDDSDNANNNSNAPHSS